MIFNTTLFSPKNIIINKIFKTNKLACVKLVGSDPLLRGSRCFVKIVNVVLRKADFVTVVRIALIKADCL